MNIVNNHPVHIIDNDGKMSPSSFIPFCTFGNKMLEMGRNFSQFNQPVCSSFQRKIFKDQLCYSVDVTEVLEEQDASENMNIGLVFLYDNNVERVLHIEEENEGKGRNTIGFLNNFVSLEETEKTLIYINSLGTTKEQKILLHMTLLLHLQFSF